MDGPLSNAFEGLGGLLDSATPLATLLLQGQQQNQLASLQAQVAAQRIAADVEQSRIAAVSPVGLAQSQYLSFALIAISAVALVILIRRRG